jgi:hypothetical protein
MDKQTDRQTKGHTNKLFKERQIYKPLAYLHGLLFGQERGVLSELLLRALLLTLHLVHQLVLVASIPRAVPLFGERIEAGREIKRLQPVSQN